MNGNREKKKDGMKKTKGFWRAIFFISSLLPDGENVENKLNINEEKIKRRKYHEEVTRGRC